MWQIFRLITLFITLAVGSVAFSQQTIISVPSSDVLPGGEIILKQSNRLGPFGDEYANLTPSMIIGTGKGTEMSLGVGTNIRENTDVRLNIGAKKVFKIHRSTRFTVGGTLTPSLTEGKNPDSMIYAHGSYLFRKTKTTLTAGGYLGGRSQMPGLGGVVLGIDQSIISNKLRFAADWRSREDTGGAFSAGFKMRPVPTTSITTAVVIPNADEERVAFSISISQYLGKPEIFRKEPSKKEGKDVDL